MNQGSGIPDFLQSSVQNLPVRDQFHNTFSLRIQIQWKSHLAFIQILTKLFSVEFELRRKNLFWNKLFMVPRIHIDSKKFTNFGMKYETMRRLGLSIKVQNVSLFHTLILNKLIHYYIDKKIICALCLIYQSSIPDLPQSRHSLRLWDWHRRSSALFLPHRSSSWTSEWGASLCMEPSATREDMENHVHILFRMTTNIEHQRKGYNSMG